MWCGEEEKNRSSKNFFSLPRKTIALSYTHYRPEASVVAFEQFYGDIEDLFEVFFGQDFFGGTGFEDRSVFECHTVLILSGNLVPAGQLGPYGHFATYLP